MKELKMSSPKKIAEVERHDPTTYITTKMDWFPTSDLRGAKTRSSLDITDKNGRKAIYQIALAKDVEDIGDNLYHEKIGYTGLSDNIFGRLYALKGGRHTASPYIKKTFDIKDIRVRIYFIDSQESVDTLEKYIHNKCEKLFGYRFAWKAASGGFDGSVMRIQDLIDKIVEKSDPKTGTEILKDISSYIDSCAVDLFISTWKQED